MPAPNGGEPPTFNLRAARRAQLIYFGVGRFAVAPLVALAQSENKIVAVVTAPPRARGRGLRESPSPVAVAAAELSLPIFAFETPAACAPLVRDLAPPFCVVCDYGRILPRGVLRLAPHFVNIHPSLLPRWRGAAPIERAILAGDKTTGVSIMKMNVGIDTGHIALQEAVAIGAQNCGELSESLSAIGARLLLRALAEWQDLELLPQTEAAIYAPKIAAAELELDFNDDAESLARRVAAFAPQTRRARDHSRRATQNPRRPSPRAAAAHRRRRFRPSRGGRDIAGRRRKRARQMRRRRARHLAPATKRQNRANRARFFARLRARARRSIRITSHHRFELIDSFFAPARTKKNAATADSKIITIAAGAARSNDSSEAY